MKEPGKSPRKQPGKKPKNDKQDRRNKEKSLDNIQKGDDIEQETSIDTKSLENLISEDALRRLDDKNLLLISLRCTQIMLSRRSPAFSARASSNPYAGCCYDDSVESKPGDKIPVLRDSQHVDDVSAAEIERYNIPPCG